MTWSKRKFTVVAILTLLLINSAVLVWVLLFKPQAEIHGQRSGVLVIAGKGNERQLSRAGWTSTAREANGEDMLESAETLPDAAGIAAALDAVERGEWCDFGVIAQGRRFIIQINGVTVSDSRDEHPAKFVPRGMLGLEYSHKNGTPDAVEFKDIRFKRLASATP